MILKKIKQLWFIDSIDDKRKHLRIGYYDAMRALLKMMPFRTEAEWQIRFYHILSTEDFYDEDEEFSDNEARLAIIEMNVSVLDYTIVTTYKILYVVILV